MPHLLQALAEHQSWEYLSGLEPITPAMSPIPKTSSQHPSLLESSSDLILPFTWSPDIYPTPLSSYAVDSVHSNSPTDRGFAQKESAPQDWLYINPPLPRSNIISGQCRWLTSSVTWWSRFIIMVIGFIIRPGTLPCWLGTLLRFYWLINFPMRIWPSAHFPLLAFDNFLFVSLLSVFPPFLLLWSQWSLWSFSHTYQAVSTLSVQFSHPMILFGGWVELFIITNAHDITTV